MSDDIKVGDVCVFIGGPVVSALGLLYTECEVIGEEKRYEFKVSEGPLHEVWLQCFGFLVRAAANGKRYVTPREFLRKKRPPADDEQLLRELGDDTPNKRVSWDGVPGYAPPSRVKEPA